MNRHGRSLYYLALRYGGENLFYWQDKSRREVDFVVRRNRDRVDAIECKINPDKLNPEAFLAFRSLYPKGENILLSPHVKRPYRIRRGGMVFIVCSTWDML